MFKRQAALLLQGAKGGTEVNKDDRTATGQMLYAKWLGEASLAKLERDETPLRRALFEKNKTLSTTKHKEEKTHESCNSRYIRRTH